MRKLLAISFLCAFAGMSFAAERRETLTINVGTNVAALTGTNVVIASGLVGKIDEVLLDLGTGATGNVTVAIIPELSTMAARNIYTNVNQTVDQVLIPRVQCTGLNGAVISGVYDQHALCKESLQVTWINAGAGGVVVKAIIKYENKD